MSEIAANSEPLVVTDSAVAKVRTLMDEEGNDA